MSQNEKLQTETLIVGAGVIGLAIAAELSKFQDIILLEKNPKFGEETSSRNSEVIHSGIYYPQHSKKTDWCIRGRNLLYEYCVAKHIPFQRCGKYLVAVNEAENAYLEMRADHCKSVGVPFRRLSNSETQSALPYLAATSALFFPESGIIDSHSLMQALETSALQAGASIQYRHQVDEIERTSGGWKVRVKAAEGNFDVMASQVINCAGLWAARLSNQALNTKAFEHRFCRGRYFGVNGSHPFKSLVYPVPPKDGLGVHVTLDLAGALRLGPDVDWSETLNYECDWESLRAPFAKAAQNYWPSLETKRLSPGLIGIRPKLFKDGVASQDFLIEEKNGFIHCLGIESPGLTSALAIAENVSQLIKGKSI